MEKPGKAAEKLPDDDEQEQEQEQEQGQGEKGEKRNKLLSTSDNEWK